MQPTRKARMASVILEELARVVPREIKDPRIPSITFTRVDVTPDGRQALVFLTVLGGGTPEQTQECLKGLVSASGYLRKHLAKSLSVRYIPVLLFKEDKGLDNSLRVHALLRKIADEPAQD